MEEEEEKRFSLFRRRSSKKDFARQNPGSSAVGARLSVVTSAKSATLPSQPNAQASSSIGRSPSGGLLSKLKRRLRLRSKGRYDFKDFEDDRPQRLRRKSDDPTRATSEQEDEDLESMNAAKATSSVKTPRKSQSDKENVILIRKDKCVSVICQDPDGGAEVIFSNMPVSAGGSDGDDLSEMWGEGSEEDPYATINSVKEEIKEKFSGGVPTATKPATCTIDEGEREKSVRAKQLLQYSMSMSSVTNANGCSSNGKSQNAARVGEELDEEDLYSKINSKSKVKKKKRKKKDVKQDKNEEEEEEVEKNSTAAGSRQIDELNQFVAAKVRGRRMEHDYETLEDVRKRASELMEEEGEECTNTSGRVPLPPSSSSSSMAAATISTPGVVDSLSDEFEIEPDYETLDEVREKVLLNTSRQSSDEATTRMSPSVQFGMRSDSDYQSIPLQQPDNSQQLSSLSSPSSNSATTGVTLRNPPKTPQPNTIASNNPAKLSSSSSERPKTSPASMLAPLAGSVTAAEIEMTADLSEESSSVDDCIYDNPNVILRKQFHRYSLGAALSPYLQRNSNGAGTLLGEQQQQQLMVSSTTTATPNRKTQQEEELVEKLSSLLAPPLPLRTYQKEEVGKGGAGASGGGGSGYGSSNVDVSRHSWCVSSVATKFWDMSESWHGGGGGGGGTGLSLHGHTSSVRMEKKSSSELLSDKSLTMPQWSKSQEFSAEVFRALETSGKFQNCKFGDTGVNPSSASTSIEDSGVNGTDFVEGQGSRVDVETKSSRGSSSSEIDNGNDGSSILSYNESGAVVGGVGGGSVSGGGVSSGGVIVSVNGDSENVIEIDDDHDEDNFHKSCKNENDNDVTTTTTKERELSAASGITGSEEEKKMEIEEEEMEEKKKEMEEEENELRMSEKPLRSENEMADLSSGVGTDCREKILEDVWADWSHCAPSCGNSGNDKASSFEGHDPKASVCESTRNDQDPSNPDPDPDLVPDSRFELVGKLRDAQKNRCILTVESIVDESPSSVEIENAPCKSDISTTFPLPFPVSSFTNHSNPPDVERPMTNSELPPPPPSVVTTTDGKTNVSSSSSSRIDSSSRQESSPTSSSFPLVHAAGATTTTTTTTKENSTTNASQNGCALNSEFKKGRTSSSSSSSRSSRSRSSSSSREVPNKYEINNSALWYNSVADGSDRRDNSDNTGDSLVDENGRCYRYRDEKKEEEETEMMRVDDNTREEGVISGHGEEKGQPQGQGRDKLKSVARLRERYEMISKDTRRDWRKKRKSGPNASPDQDIAVISSAFEHDEFQSEFTEGFNAEEETLEFDMVGLQKTRTRTSLEGEGYSFSAPLCGCESFSDCVCQEENVVVVAAPPSYSNDCGLDDGLNGSATGGGGCGGCARREEEEGYPSEEEEGSDIGRRREGGEGGIASSPFIRREKTDGDIFNGLSSCNDRRCSRKERLKKNEEDDENEVDVVAVPWDEFMRPITTIPVKQNTADEHTTELTQEQSETQQLVLQMTRFFENTVNGFFQERIAIEPHYLLAGVFKWARGYPPLPTNRCKAVEEKLKRLLLAYRLALLSEWDCRSEEYEQGREGRQAAMDALHWKVRKVVRKSEGLPTFWDVRLSLLGSFLARFQQSPRQHSDTTSTNVTCLFENEAVRISPEELTMSRHMLSLDTWTEGGEEDGGGERGVCRPSSGEIKVAKEEERQSSIGAGAVGEDGGRLLPDGVVGMRRHHTDGSCRGQESSPLPASLPSLSNSTANSTSASLGLSSSPSSSSSLTTTTVPSCNFTSPEAVHAGKVPKSRFATASQGGALYEFLSMCDTDDNDNENATCNRRDESSSPYESDEEDEREVLNTYIHTVAAIPVSGKEKSSSSSLMKTATRDWSVIDSSALLSMCRAFHGELAYTCRIRTPRQSPAISDCNKDNSCRCCHQHRSCPRNKSSNRCTPRMRHAHLSNSVWEEMDQLMKKLIPHISPRLDFQFLLRTYAEFKFFILGQRRRNWRRNRKCFQISTEDDGRWRPRCCMKEEITFMKLLRDELRHFASVLRLSSASESLFLEDRDVGSSLTSLLRITLTSLTTLLQSPPPQPPTPQQPLPSAPSAPSAHHLPHPSSSSSSTTTTSTLTDKDGRLLEKRDGAASCFEKQEVGDNPSRMDVQVDDDNPSYQATDTNDDDNDNDDNNDDDETDGELLELRVLSPREKAEFHINNYKSFRAGCMWSDLDAWQSPEAFLDDPNVLDSKTGRRSFMVDRDTNAIHPHTTWGHYEEPRPLQEREDFLESMQQLQLQEWYWGPVSYEQAASVLRGFEDGSFLVRDSSDRKYLLSLSFKSLGEVYHTRIEHAKGLFSFWSQPDSHGKARICEFIEKSVQNSHDGKFLYFLRPMDLGNPPLPIRLLNPVSRNFRVPSLRHLARFVIRQLVRRDHMDFLPVPQKVKGYLRQKQFYVEFRGNEQWNFEANSNTSTSEAS